jgi:hypothetical protein
MAKPLVDGRKRIAPRLQPLDPAITTAAEIREGGTSDEAEGGPGGDALPSFRWVSGMLD